MPLRRPLITCTAGAVIALLVLSGCSGVDRAGSPTPVRAVTLKMVDPLTSDELAPFLAAVRRLSHGTITIHVSSKWHADDETQAVSAVRNGDADLADVPVRAWHEVGVHGFDALIAPLAVDSLALENAVLASDLSQHMLDGVSSLGLTGLGLVPGPMRQPVGIDRVLIAPADYRGAVIGVNESAVAKLFFAQLGARTVALHFQGQSIRPYDGIEQQVTSIDGNRYDGVASTITANVDLWPRPLSIVANTRAFNRLPFAQRDALRSAASQSLAAATTRQQSDEQEATGNLCRRALITFVTAPPSALAQLRQAARPVLARLNTDAATHRALVSIDAMRARVADSVPPPSCDGITPDPPARAAAAGAAGPLDGTWAFHETRSQLLAHGVPASDAVPENYGDFVLLVDRGRFTQTQQNDSACTWGYGTWVITDHQVEMRFIDGGGIAPTGAVNRPGELFDYTWSLYRDTFTLGNVPGALSPPGQLGQPWRRLSIKADAGKLFARCGLPAAGVPR